MPTEPAQTGYCNFAISAVHGQVHKMGDSPEIAGLSRKVDNLTLVVETMLNGFNDLQEKFHSLHGEFINLALSGQEDQSVLEQDYSGQPRGAASQGATGTVLSDSTHGAALGQKNQPSSRGQRLKQRVGEAGNDPGTGIHAQINLVDSLGSSPSLEGIDLKDAAGVQREYEVLKDSLAKIKLPGQLKVNDSRQGIKRSEQTAVNIVSKGSRYTETALRWLLSVDRSQVSVQDLDRLLVILTAQVNFFQTEFAGLLVQSSFDSGTSRLFKVLEKNTCVFSDESLGNLRRAAEIQAHQNLLSQTSQQQGYYRGRGYGWNRGRDRGSFRGRGRGYFSGQDPFMRHVQSRSNMATARSDDDAQ